MEYHNGVAARADARPGENVSPDSYAFRRAPVMKHRTASHQQIFDNFTNGRPNYRRETNPTDDNAVTDETDFSNKFSDNRRHSSRYYRRKSQVTPVGDDYKFSVMERKDLEGFSPPNYENLNFDGGSEKFPSKPADIKESEFEGAAVVLKAPTPLPFVFHLVPRTLTYRPPSLVYEDIYEACIRYVKEHFCYSSRFVRQMDLTEIKNDSAFHYVLRTFCERRESTFISVPYIGQVIDGPEDGPTPAPWDIRVQPPALFQSGKVEVEIPHTAFVDACPVCTGTGRVTCSFCYGRGRRRCIGCLGTGRMKDGMCIACFGSGRSWCTQCSGSGKEKCEKCDGRRHIKVFRILIVTWMNFRKEFMSNTHHLPEHYLKTVTGNRMLFEEDEMLAPIVNAPDESINEASSSIMERQRESLQNMRILRQRHVLNAVPLTKVSYAWRGKDGEFYVYGQEKNVYFQQYPQTCCCCTCL